MFSAQIMLRRYGRQFGSLRVEPLEDRLLLASDAVLQWNEVLLDAIRVDRTAPPLAARDMAIVHVAIYDAVNAIEKTYEPYAVDAQGMKGASPEAAVAAAAHQTLVELFPAQQSTFDQALTDSLATVPDGSSENKGVALGRFVAKQILAIRSDDGASAEVPYTVGLEPGDWQPTPPAFQQPPLLPQWPAVEPFALHSGAQFQPPPPPDLTSAEYTAGFDQVKQLGAVDSPSRTADQTQIALFWINGPGTATPPGHWNVIAQVVAEQAGNTLLENARLFALLNIAEADAGIVSWDAKYAYNFWRPVTAIRAADIDGNPATVADPAWTPLIPTPPFPAYTSGHSTFSAAGAAVLADFFGTDEFGFTLKSENPAAADRSFTSFSQAADESGLSRIYGGIHWSFDNEQGLATGDAVGQFVFQNELRPISPNGRAGVGESAAALVNNFLSPTPLYITHNNHPEPRVAAPPRAEIVSPRPTDPARAASDEFALPADSVKEAVGPSRETDDRTRDALFAKLSESDWSWGVGLRF